MARTLLCLARFWRKPKEAGARGFYWPAVAGHPRFPRGVVEYAGTLDFDLDAIDESGEPTLKVVLYGPSNEPFGQLNLVGGLRRAMAKCGYTDLKSFQKVGLAVR